ncbi:hypothetical protein KTD15_06375 [Burkholderia multivorans]|uniref:hypothetical protein n=1 Tax=Burkholderia multivorans TaxID=87883 RepID=UPI001C22D38E|nr:hypothetical protein [Burkholderia multivorans]MBU9118420.1 hypothetical protein [Burkholderia multivorans]MBU9434134.1 hypothetical protein [Burkholderia multivorans]MDN8018114.1 hypothetical protein [Burkholderia multivorans]
MSAYMNTAITKITLTQVEDFFKSLNAQLVKQGRNYFIKKEGKDEYYWVGSRLIDLQRLFKYGAMHGVFKFLELE